MKPSPSEKLANYSPPPIPAPSPSLFSKLERRTWEENLNQLPYSSEEKEALLAAWNFTLEYLKFRTAKRLKTKSTRLKRKRTSNFEPWLDAEQAIYLLISDTSRVDPFEWIGFLPAYRRSTGYEYSPLILIDRGCRTHVNTDARTLFHSVLETQCDGFILVHNHPSGNLSPSQEDHLLTEKVQGLARALGVPLLGHAIVSHDHHEWVPHPGSIASPPPPHH